MPRCGVPCTPLPPCGKRELTAQALRSNVGGRGDIRCNRYFSDNMGWKKWRIRKNSLL